MENKNSVAKRTLLMAGVLIAMIMMAVVAKAASIDPISMP
jgi:hypothetical protein